MFNFPHKRVKSHNNSQKIRLIFDPFEYDEALRADGSPVIAGIDEAGRGPLAGPVVAAAVVLPSGTKIDGLKDSKKVSPKKREALFWEVLSVSADLGIGVIEPRDIDRLNIYRATQHAMCMAVEDLRIRPDTLVIDAMKLPLHIKQISMPRAEDVSASVAAASIVAKVTRDRLMEHFHTLYPQYGFGRHKGYGTREHLKMIEDYGPCPIHRMSFAPLSSLNLPF